MILPIADTTFVEATWILILKSIVIFAVIFAIVPMLTVMERKLLGRFQARYGPNRVGPLALRHHGLNPGQVEVGVLLPIERFRRGPPATIGAEVAGLVPAGGQPPDGAEATVSRTVGHQATPHRSRHTSAPVIGSTRPA